MWLQTLVANFEHLKKQLPVLGIGLGYRSAVFEQTLEQANRIDWLEIISEQYMNAGGKVLNLLEQATSVFSLIPHGVSLSIGSTDQLNVSYLKSLKRLIDKLNPPWWSDHLSFSGHGGVHMNELLPLPFTRETARYVAQRARVLQELMERPFLLENITYYMKLPGSEMTEAQFISEVLELSDCGLLLDITMFTSILLITALIPMNFFGKFLWREPFRFMLLGISMRRSLKWCSIPMVRQFQNLYLTFFRMLSARRM